VTDDDVVVDDDDAVVKWQPLFGRNPAHTFLGIRGWFAQLSSS